MAVVWQHYSEQVHYEVRSHGATMRLYANGIQHSEFHPRRLVTGSVWDLLWLPALFHGPRRCRRVLVLGLGGGSLVAPLRELVNPDLLVGVEMDPLHLQVAEEVFGIGGEGVELYCADARDWVASWNGEPFDLVIEDLFAPVDRDVTRAVEASRSWFNRLAALVSPSGTLVMNFGDYREFRSSAAAARRLRRGWQAGFRFSTPDCHNAVMAWLREPSDSKALRERVRSHRELSRALDKGRLDYHVRRVFG